MNLRPQSLIRFSLLFASLIGGLVLVFSILNSATAPLSSVGTVIDPPRLLKDFTLTDQTGKPLRLTDLRGHTTLVFFGYTNCPDVCPVAVANFKHIKTALGKAADQVAFVFISVDGSHDTPEVLTRFLNAFDPTFIGLTGDEAMVLQIGFDFLTTFSRDPATGLIEHGSRLFLVDRRGQLRVAYLLDVPPETIAAEMLKIGNRAS